MSTHTVIHKRIYIYRYVSTHTIIHKQVYKKKTITIFHSLNFFSFLSYSRFLDCNVPSTAQDHLRTNHTFKMILHQLKTQVTFVQFTVTTLKPTNHPSIHHGTATHDLELFIFYRHSPWETACLNHLWLWARWPVLFRGPKQKTIKKQGDDWREMKVNGPERRNFRHEKNSRQREKYAPPLKKKKKTHTHKTRKIYFKQISPEVQTKVITGILPLILGM